MFGSFMPFLTAELPGDVSNAIVTTEMFQPLTETFTANLGVIIPIGVTLFGMVLGISYAIRFFKRSAS